MAAGKRKRRALGYVRVSTAEQANGFGLEVQEGAIRQHAKRSELRLLTIHRDEGLSGSNGLDARPGLAQALARLEAHEADALLVYRLDRLARDLVLSETIVTRLQRAGVHVVSVTEPDVDGDDATRVLVRQVLAVLAQYERAVIRSRMLAGKAAKKAQGGYAGGRPRFGYQAKDGALVPVQREQQAIELARRLRRDRLSLREIADRLSKAGHTPKGGGRWHPTQIARLTTGRAKHRQS